MKAFASEIAIKVIPTGDRAVEPPFGVVITRVGTAVKLPVGVALYLIVGTGGIRKQRRLNDSRTKRAAFTSTLDIGKGSKQLPRGSRLE